MANLERLSHPEELRSVKEDSDSTKQLVKRIENALLEHLEGISLEDAFNKNKINKAKYHQLLRFNVGNIIESDVYVKSEQSKL